MEDYYTLTETSSNFNEVIGQTFQSLNRSKLLSFEVCQKFAVFGASSGGIYVFYRSPCQFLKLLPTKEGAVELLAISPNEKYLAVATSKGIVIVFDECFREDKKIKFQVYSEHQGRAITCLRWHDYNLFAGDNEGKVSVTTFSSTLLTKAIFQPAMFVILRLDSSIFQLDSYTHYLLVSTKTRTYLCDTENETFKQIGKKLRDGDYGACFFNIVSSITENQNDSKENGTKSGRETHEVEIYCARPGVRLWQANFEPSVIFTHQFKEGLHKQRSEIILLDNDPDSILKFVKFDSDESVQNFNFGKLLVVCERFILTFNSNGFYIFDPLETRLSFWCSYANIKDVKVVGSMVHVWRDGKVNVVSLSKIEDLILHTLFKRQYHLCTELCLKFSSVIIKNIENYKKIHLIGILSEKLPMSDNALLEKIAPLLDQVKANSIKHFGDQNQDVEISLNSSNEKLYETSLLTENIWHLKSVSLVTDKINKSTKNIKEKFQKFETAVKNFAIDTIKDNNETDVLDDCGINISDKEDNDNSDSFKEIGILYKGDNESCITSSTSTSTSAGSTPGSNTNTNTTEITNEIKDESTEKNISLLFNQFKMTEMNQNFMIPNFEQLIDSSDFDDLKNIFTKFSLYMKEQGYENVNRWCQEQYLKFISKSKSKKYNLEDLSHETTEYLIEAFHEVNATSLRNSCDCGYPTPAAKNNSPRFYEIGKKLIVSSNDLYKAALSIPYMWKDYLKSLNCSELSKNLNLVIQYNDLNLLERFSRHLYFDYWDEIVKLNIKLNKKLCLNCNREMDIYGLVNWTDLGLQILKSLGGLNTLQLLQNYADYLPKWELDAEFYQACIFSMSTAEYNTDIDKHWNLFVKLQRKEDTKKEVTNALELFLNKSYLGGPKEDSFMIPAINCSFCDIPINTPILDKFLKLDCGHMYHTLCFSYLNNNCQFC